MTETFYVYHIVTNKKMEIGQKIILDDTTYNTLYTHFLEKSITNEKNEDIFQLLGNYDAATTLTLRQEDATVLKRYLGSTVRAIREITTELVRVQQFPHYPSRLSCLYTTLSYEDLLKWVAIFESFNRTILQIVKLKVNGRFFEADASLLPKANGASFHQKMNEAYEYWTVRNEDSLKEVLVDGEIEVIEIIHDYT